MLEAPASADLENTVAGRQAIRDRMGRVLAGNGELIFLEDRQEAEVIVGVDEKAALELIADAHHDGQVEVLHEVGRVDLSQLLAAVFHRDLVLDVEAELRTDEHVDAIIDIGFRQDRDVQVIVFQERSQVMARYRPFDIGALHGVIDASLDRRDLVGEKVFRPETDVSARADLGLQMGDVRERETDLRHEVEFLRSRFEWHDRDQGHETQQVE